jgi:hypothetical protein
VHILKSAQTPDGKPGRELAQWAEGFFRLDFLLLFYQEKSSSPRGNERTRVIHYNENTFQTHRAYFENLSVTYNPQSKSL